eukprot:4249031-Amphidinium_carterae.1
MLLAAAVLGAVVDALLLLLYSMRAGELLVYSMCAGELSSSAKCAALLLECTMGGCTGML